MFKLLIGIIRFIIIGWWCIPAFWTLNLLLTADIADSNELAKGIFLGTLN